jgi:hypothetical protein
MAPWYRQWADKVGLHRSVCDYLAGMTDRFAEQRARAPARLLTALRLAGMTSLALVACARPGPRAPGSSPPRAVSAPAPIPPLPSERQRRWQEFGYYAFVHFNMNTFSGAEWGDRPGGSEALRAERARLPSVGARRARRRDERDHPDREAPRRLLSLAFGVHRARRRELGLEGRQGRRTARALRRVRRVRPEVRRLPLAVGSQLEALRRFARLQRLLREPTARGALELRAGVRSLVGRRVRRGSERQAPGLRLRALHVDRARAPTERRDLQRHRPRRALGRQRAGLRGRDVLVDALDRRVTRAASAGRRRSAQPRAIERRPLDARRM